MKFIKTGYLLLFADYDKIKVGEREERRNQGGGRVREE